MLTNEWQRAPGAHPDGNSVEVRIAALGAAIEVRDSKNPDGDVLVFTRGEWDAFVAGAKDREFDLEDES